MAAKGIRKHYTECQHILHTRKQICSAFVTNYSHK